MRHAPEAIPGDLRHVKDPYVVTGPDRQLGRGDRHQHDDDQRDRGEAREKTKNDQYAADDLDRTDKRTHHLRVLYPDIGKAPGTEDLWENELLNSFRKKDDQADHQTNKSAQSIGYCP